MKNWVVALMILGLAAGTYWLAQPGRIASLRQDQLAGRCALIDASLKHVDDQLRAGNEFALNLSGLIASRGPLRVEFEPDGWASLSCDSLPHAVHVEWNRVVYDPTGLDNLSSVQAESWAGFGPSEISLSGRTAKIEFFLICGGLCGHGWDIHLERAGENWQVVRIERTWVS